MLLCVVLVLALAVPAGAEGQGAYLYSLVSYQDASVSLVSIPMAEEAMTVLVNGEPFSGYGVTTALEAGLPVTYYCMVDQSTSLSQKQRILDRQCDRLLVPPVVAHLPFGSLGIEHRVEGKLRESRLDISGSGSTVAGEDITPVTLGVDQQVLLSQLHKGVAD